MLRTARPLPGGQGPQLARSSPFARRYFWLPAAEAVWGISDPEPTFRCNVVFAVRRGPATGRRWLTRSLASSVVPARDELHHASCSNSAFASFKSKVSKPSVNQP
jgi:hypothetical protein